MDIFEPQHLTHQEENWKNMIFFKKNIYPCQEIDRSHSENLIADNFLPLPKNPAAQLNVTEKQFERWAAVFDLLPVEGDWGIFLCDPQTPGTDFSRVNNLRPVSERAEAAKVD